MNRYMKRLILILTVIVLASCDNSFRNVRIVSANVDSFSPEGLRSVSAVINVTANNPGKSIEITDMSVVAKYRKSELVIFSCDSVALDAQCQKTYRVPVYGQLAQGTSILSLLSLASDFNANEMNLDVQGTIRTGGKNKQKVKLRNIPASKLIKNL